MDHQTLEKLQFSVIRDLLAQRCSSSLGKQLAERIEPSGRVEIVRRWMGQVRELQHVADTFGLPPLGAIRDVRESIHASATPAGLESEALAVVANALEATGGLCRWVQDIPPDAPLLERLCERIGDFTPIADRIHEAIDARGRIRDDASPKIASIRATIVRARAQIDIVFNRLLRHPSVTRFLQYANATIHNDRKVLPLKAEHRGRITGIVHRSSDSGATLFVEPAEAVELNNTIVRLGLDEHKEISRILRDLSHLVHRNADEILKTLRAVAVLDVLVAKVRYARDYQALVPEIGDDRKLELWQARHPVLETVFEREAADGGEVRNVVPIDVRLGDDFDLLVITGPNTGGKTVALKTVGLLALMNQAGIPIPVAPMSTLPVYQNIFVDIGDEQSIEQSLSTFSSHLSSMLDTLRRAGPGSLVLIDELGSGTDPDEGAAIGRAIMDELLRLGASSIVTTHLSALKAVAYNEPRVDNASAEFDPETLKPLFRIRLGEPGNSNALIIARRLGMSQEMVNRAKAHLDGRHRALANAIASTSATRRQAENARREAADAKRAAEQERHEYERQAHALDQAREAHDRWVAWINALRQGDRVFVRSFERLGTIVRMQLQQQTALVSAGSLDFEIRLQELAPPNTAEDQD